MAAVLDLSGAMKQPGAGKTPPEAAKPLVTDQLSQVPAPPANMAQPAADEWRELAPVAHELGVLTQADLRSFRLLCETLATAATAQSTLDDEGLLIDGSHGAKKHHPAIKILENSRQQATRLFGEFGLTPKARQQVKITLR